MPRTAETRCTEKLRQFLKIQAHLISPKIGKVKSVERINIFGKIRQNIYLSKKEEFH